MPSDDELNQKKSLSAINLDVGVRAELRAEIKTEIPAESSGRLLDALTDVFRPFSERRGLRADQIRLQREDVLIEIAKRARRRLEIEGKAPNPIPNKFLIPFMEKASLEDKESELVDTWAKLLASAATSYKSSLIRYASVLSEIGHREVEMLDRMCRSHRSNRPITHIEDAPLSFREWAVALVLETDVLVKVKNHNFKGAALEKILSDFVMDTECPGGIILLAYVYLDESRDAFCEAELSHPKFPNSDGDKEALSILESIGLIKEQIVRVENEHASSHAHFVALTPFGLGFYVACNPETAKAIEQSYAEEADDEGP